MPQDHFGEDVADRYDTDEAKSSGPQALAPVLDLLEELAAGGPALELAIGTGRVALPLSARGVPVEGVDLSPAMLARLRAKPGADRVPAVQGDMTRTRVPGAFSLVYLVYNTIGNVITQDEQVACFRNAAAHLQPGGRFLVEVGVPDLQRLPPGETVRPFDVSAGHLGFDEYDVATQGLVSHHYRLEGGRVQHGSTPFRYVWPAELDLMARLAGMVLLHRWAGWEREPCASDSRRHVSVWQRTATPVT